MQLNLTDICSITTGACQIDLQSDGIHFKSFTQQEETVYLARDPAEKRIEMTSGIQMEFSTDAETLYLRVNTSACINRNYFSMDIYVNDVMVDCISNYPEDAADTIYVWKQFPLGVFEKTAALGAGTKTVRIVFPFTVKTVLEEMSLDGTYIQPIRKEKKLITYGDSITQGMDALHASGTYAVRLARLLDAELCNKGIGGEHFFPELAQAADDSCCPDYITVAYGTNDWFLAESKEQFSDWCTGFLGTLAVKYPNVKIYVLSPIWRAEHTGEKACGTFFDAGACIEHVCGAYPNLIYASGWNLVSHDPMLFAERVLHPNEKGFSQYARGLYDIICKNK